MSTGNLIAPHGGTLVNRFADGNLADEAANLPSITLSTKQACDLEMIAIGAFSPLTGFCKKADFESICTDMRLADGTVWPIPITLAVDEDVKNTLTQGGKAALYHADGHIHGNHRLRRNLCATIRHLKFQMFLVRKMTRIQVLSK